MINGLADESSAAVLLAAIDAASPWSPGTPAPRPRSASTRWSGSAGSTWRTPRAHAPARGGGHPHVIVTTDDATLFPADHQPVDTDESPNPGSPGAVLVGIGRIPASTAQRLACDGELTS